MRRAARMMHAVLPALLAACAVTAPTVAPPPPVAPTPDPADAAFWARFGSPVLLDLQQQLLRENPDLLIARQRLLIANDAVQLADAGQRPSLGFHAGPVDTTATSLADRGGARPEAFELGFQASYELDLWGRLARLGDAARAEALAAGADADALRIATQCLLARRVFDLARDEQMLPLLQQRQVLAAERAQLQGLRLHAGRIDAQTLADAESQSSEAQSALANGTAQQRGDEARLALLFGESARDDHSPLAPLQSMIRLPEVPADLPSTLLERRPDVRAAAARLAAARDRDAADRALRFPQIRLTAALGVATDVLHRAAHGAIALFGFGPEVDLPIYDGGATAARIDSRDHELAIAEIEYRQAGIAAFADVEHALQLRDTAASALRDASAARQRSDAAQQALQLELEQGRRSRLDAIEARLQSLDAEQRVLDSYRAQLDSSLALFEALGGAWPLDRHPALSSSAAEIPLIRMSA
ncbi:TolC family protein [Solimonas terrae]|uniref:TolC family protein n=1 Tax=Solimonas terrae TaxID=1396819 RepID=A0A6M2BTQ2_9GAMM|nr:TolC family protein [Solimonas terrae]NGY05996.1 TolC family protein [Solimonas terrae]